MSPKTIALGSVALVAALGIAADVSAGPPAIFQRIKDKENAAAPLPKDSAEIVLGAIDCDSSIFTMGAFPMSTTEVGGGGYNTVQRTTRYAVGAFAKHARMRLDATNRKGRRLSASLSFGASAQNGAGGLVNPKVAGDGADSVTFDIGESSGRFTFAVQCGAAVANGPRLANDGQPSTGYADAVHCPKTNPYCACPPASPACTRTQALQSFDHAHVWADSGAFEVEAVPVAIVYEPPVDRARRSFAQLTFSPIVGSAASVAFVSPRPGARDVEAALTEPALASRAASDVARKLLATGDGHATGEAAVFELLASGLGALKIDDPNAASTATSAGLVTRLSAHAPTRTGTQGDLRGPGDGDYVWYYPRATFAWEAEGDAPMRLVFLGADGLRAYQVWQLKADLAEIAAKSPAEPGARTALHKTTIDSLLALDPFAAGAADVTLPAARFVDATAQLEPGADKVCPKAPKVYPLKVDPAYARGDASAAFRTEATKYGKGWPAFLGGTGTESGPISTKISVSRAHDTFSAPGPVYEAHLAADSSDTYCAKVYFDKLFGTFAFMPVRAG
jgi:hypothetical protein